MRQMGCLRRVVLVGYIGVQSTMLQYPRHGRLNGSLSFPSPESAISVMHKCCIGGDHPTTSRTIPRWISRLVNSQFDYAGIFIRITTRRFLVKDLTFVFVTSYVLGLKKSVEDDGPEYQLP